MYMEQSMMCRAEKLFERVWCAHEHIRYIGMVLAKNRSAARRWRSAMPQRDAPTAPPRKRVKAAPRHLLGGVTAEPADLYDGPTRVAEHNIAAGLLDRALRYFPIAITAPRSEASISS